MAGESGRALKEVGVDMRMFYLFCGRFRRDRIVLLVGDRAVGRVVAQHLVARAAHGQRNIRPWPSFLMSTSASCHSAPHGWFRQINMIDLSVIDGVAA